MYGIFTIKRCTINSYHKKLSLLHKLYGSINYAYSYMETYYTRPKSYGKCDCEVEVREHLKAE